MKYYILTAQVLAKIVFYNLLKLDFDDTFVKPLHWSSISQAYTRVLDAQDFPKRMTVDVYCNVY